MKSYVDTNVNIFMCVRVFDKHPELLLSIKTQILLYRFSTLAAVEFSPSLFMTAGLSPVTYYYCLGPTVG